MIHLSRESWHCETAAFVPSDLSNYLKNGFSAYRFFKYLRRKVFMALSGQSRKVCNFIPASAQRILWVNLSAPSLGDALMDTSARSLLNGRHVDLLTSAKNSKLFDCDPYYESVFTPSQIGLIRLQRYDLCIVDSFSPRSLIAKMRACSRAPIVGLYGHLNGYEIHRTLFSFYRLSYLLRISPPSPGSVRLTLSAKQGAGSLSPLGHLDRPTLCVGIGGEWGFRTYSQWGETLRRLIPRVQNWRIRLVGSENGVEAADGLLSELTAEGHQNIDNLVGKTDLVTLIKVLSQSQAYLGADGGTWHMASALGLPSVVLFADCQLFDMHGKAVGRDVPGQLCQALFASEDVNEISPEVLADTTFQMLSSLAGVN
jgi:ADP-heptose:LPS heptosyltransferase